MTKKTKERVYKGIVVCPICHKERELETTDETLLTNPPRCFKCFMSNKEIINE